MALGKYLVEKISESWLIGLLRELKKLTLGSVSRNRAQSHAAELSLQESHCPCGHEEAVETGSWPNRMESYHCTCWLQSGTPFAMVKVLETSVVAMQKIKYLCEHPHQQSTRSPAT